MEKSHFWLKIMLVMLCLAAPGAQAFSVNETVNGYHIGFEARDDTNATMKLWGGELSGKDMPIGNISRFSWVVAGKSIDLNKDVAICAVLVLDGPQDTDVLEEKFIKNLKDDYVRVHDRVIDGHQGILLMAGENSSDPDMEYRAFYFLDEMQGQAEEIVFIASTWSWDGGSEALLNTVHVEPVGVSV